jgi:hypothetical protein
VEGENTVHDCLEVRVTAEIAILNRSAVVLAADSALTVGRDRVWKNSNKLFHLSHSTDIGVMVYGNGDFCGVPWEVVLKQFRKSVGVKKFDKLSDCVSDFRNYLDSFSGYRSGDERITPLVLTIGLRDELLEEMKSQKIVGKVKNRKALVKLLNSEIARLSSQEVVLPDLTLGNFTTCFGKDVIELFSETFSSMFKVTQSNRKLIVKAAFEAFRREHESAVETGVVFAGFGEQEFFPCVVEITVDGRFADKARAWLKREHDINKGGQSCIMPFAQADMTFLFMEGLLPQFEGFIEKSLVGVLEKKSEEIINLYVPQANRVVERELQRKQDEARIDVFVKSFSEMRRKSFINPMLKVLNSLPKEEMAAMAEALVDITSLRRKVGSSVESVGGPIDVAILSKSDGFVWIKRKHYFDVALNPDFVARRKERFGM